MKYDMIVKLVLSFLLDLKLIQFDVNIAFLYGDLEEIIYIKQPTDFELDNRVYLLRKSLYKTSINNGIKELVNLYVNIV